MAQDVHNKKSRGQGDDERLRLMLKLSLIPGFGFVSYRKLKEQLGDDPERVFILSSAQLRQIGLAPKLVSCIPQKRNKQFDSILDWLNASSENHIIHYEDPRYPPLLREIASPPLVLFCRGNLSGLQQYQLAIVGSRNPTVNGKQSALNLAQQLVESGWTITSGLAMGIDAAAHQGALLGNGTTIAVLGTAIDTLYPKRNVSLASGILQNGGCIISEFAPGTPTKPENFPRRNRLISGMSLGVLVVQAAIKSGSLISARYALEQNREVFAVPGNIHNPLVRGCHYLIKQGAKLVEEVDDINDEFQTVNFLQHVNKEKNLKKNERESLAYDKLLDSVDHDVTAVDVVAQRSNMSITDVLAQLLQYELRGLVAAVPGGYVKLGGK